MRESAPFLSNTMWHVAEIWRSSLFNETFPPHDLLVVPTKGPLLNMYINNPWLCAEAEQPPLLLSNHATFVRRYALRNMVFQHMSLGEFCDPPRLLVSFCKILMPTRNSYRIGFVEWCYNQTWGFEGDCWRTRLRKGVDCLVRFCKIQSYVQASMVTRQFVRPESQPEIWAKKLPFDGLQNLFALA